ncbi:MAG: ABC transporter ATP-binding protein [Bacillaceae bacterium]|nr:ABC transporter ATP-binding protein [Bacillaceae bacterium]
MTALLEVNNLHIAFRKEKSFIPTVEGVSFHVNSRETVGIVGESGCGKSVTSLAIMGLLPRGISRIDYGEILFEGQNLVGLSSEEYRKIRGREISMIFQEPMTSLNPVFTIGDQLMEMVLEHTAQPKKQAFKHSVEMLEKVGIPRAEEIMHDYPHQLSGGMRQRVMIAMALSLNPKLLIADEPTTALDVTIQAQILELMQQIKNDFDTSVIMITHDLGVVAEVCDRVVVMYAGKVVEQGDVKAIFKNPRHPYTIGLLQSVPSLTEERDQLYSIRGSVPLPENMPAGCRFASRCDHAKPECFEHEPPEVQIEGDHTTSCWLYR